MKTQSNLNIKSFGVFTKLTAMAILVISLSTACEKTEVAPPERANKGVVDNTSTNNCFDGCEDLIHGEHHPL